MEKLRYTMFGIVLGMIFGAGASQSLTVATGTPSRPQEGGVWTVQHSAIPAQPQQEASPTF